MTKKESPFVFHDPSGRRWVRFSRTVKTAAIALGLFIAVVVLIAFTGPQLPVLGLPAVVPLPQLASVPGIVRGRRVPVNVPWRLPKPSAPLRYVRSASPVLHPRPAAKALAARPFSGDFT